jgi:beta,beta-carotene 9',10'-dioxygenase
MNAPNPVKLGFTSLEGEVVLDQLELRGTIPAWLSGSLLRVGPAKFEVGPTAYAHWFDGLSMLHRFSFENGRVSYANKFLESLAYREAMARGRIAIREFATMPSESKIARMFSNLLGPITDNANVNISRMGGRVVALTETTHAMSFDPWTLGFTGELIFDDKLKAQVWTAHPHYDFQRKKLYNLMIAFGPRNSYKFYSMDEGSNTRVLLCEIKSSRPSYVHSFAMTENYLVLTEHPLVVTSIKLKVGWSPFIENYRWDPARGSKMTVIRKDDGKIVATREMDPFFTFHHVNAFEEKGTVVVDLVKFPDATVIEKLYLESLRASEHALGTFERYRLPLAGSTGVLRSERLSDQRIELPTINYATFNARAYSFVYAVGASERGAFDRITKIGGGAELSWQEDQCHPGEPIFVAAPDAKSEDDGLLLSLVLDSVAKRSFLLILDARDLSEKGRAFLPHHVPFGFHGQYFDKIRRPA